MPKHRWVWVALIVGMSIGVPIGWADEHTLGYAEGTTRKLGRGICNVATGPLELIRKPSLVNQQDGGLAGATIGIVQGIWATVAREVVGVYEVATFFLPIPRGFHPIVTPEFVYANGNWSP